MRQGQQQYSMVDDTMAHNDLPLTELVVLPTVCKAYIMTDRSLGGKSVIAVERARVFLLRAQYCVRQKLRSRAFSEYSV